MNQYILKNFGCKANLYDSQLIEQELQNRGWVPQEGTDPEVRLCIVNSCTVTDEADRQTRKMAMKLAREYPQAKIVVTGCAAEVDPEGLAQSQGVHFVVGNQNKDQIVDLVLQKISETESLISDSEGISSDILKQADSIDQYSEQATQLSKTDSSKEYKEKLLGTVTQYSEIISRHPMDREWPAAIDSFQVPPTQLKGYAGKTRSFLKIQEGCNSFCTYCIIPYGRGPSRSLDRQEVVNQVKALVDSGIREVVITGTNIGDYGIDWGKGPLLGDLLEQILAETSLERLRVSSLDPTEITPQMISLMRENSRFCPHFHVSLQSPHSRILKLMKRKYGSDEVIHCLNQISQIRSHRESLSDRKEFSTDPLVGGVFVGMDIITGFPGETDEEFEWGYELLKSLPWSRLHVFPYSERTGTPATRLPQSVPQHIRVQRAKKLNQLSMDRLTQNYRELLSRCQKGNLRLDSVLLEKQGDKGWIAGYTRNYLRVMVPYSPEIARNQEVSVSPMDLMIDSKAQDVALVSRLN